MCEAGGSQSHCFAAATEKAQSLKKEVGALAKARHRDWQASNFSLAVYRKRCGEKGRQTRKNNFPENGHDFINDSSSNCSQCRELNTGLMWVLLEILGIKCITAFWTSCSKFSIFSGTARKIAFAKSNLDCTRAFVTRMWRVIAMSGKIPFRIC